MFTLRRVLPVLLLLGLAAPGWGQRVSRRTEAPGVWYQGRFFGYQAGGQSVGRPWREAGPRRASAGQEPGETDRAAHGRAVEPVAFDQGVLLPEAEWSEGPVEDLAWDGDGYPGGGCDHCGTGAADDTGIWGGADFLIWWTRGMSTPPLATSSLDGTVQDQAGVLGLPGTTILSGGHRILDDSRAGGRFFLGGWLDDYHDRAIEASYLLLEDDGTTFVASGADGSILARPFHDIQNGTADARLIVYPNLVDGMLSIETRTRFQALDILFRRAITRWCDARLDLVLGYRYAKLDDLLLITENTQSLSGPTQGATIALFDQFDTENRFNGGTIGLKFLNHAYGCWSLEGVANVALGSTRSVARVSGQTVTTTDQAGSATTPAGLLTQATNIGTHGRSKFSTISEFGVSLRRNFTDHLSARIGYTLLYWTNVMRAGEQVDLDVNPSQIPPGTLNGPARPAFPFATTNFWAQGLNLGLEYRY